MRDHESGGTIFTPDPIRCAYDDCYEQHPVARDEGDEQVTCPHCLAATTTQGDTAMTTHICPIDDIYDADGEKLVGCGATFSSTPDDEGHVDCPECGMWFKARNEEAAA